MILDALTLAQSGCAHVLARSPGNIRYAGDCCIRFWQGKSWADLAATVGVEAEEYRITGGIGTLVVRESGQVFLPTLTAPHQPALRVTDGEAALRADLCRACPQYRVDADKCALCGCGFVIAERTRSAFAHCPAGNW